MMTGPGVQPPDEFEMATAPASYMDPFVDVPGNHRYRTAILGVSQQGIAGGYKAATGLEFRPQDQLLRAQFAKMVCEAFDVPVSEDLVSPFTDLGPDDPGNLYPLEKIEAEAPGAYRWDQPHLANLRKAYANDLLSSLVDWMQRWDAGAPCSRGEAAQLIWNALSLLDQTAP